MYTPEQRREFTRELQLYLRTISFSDPRIPTVGIDGMYQSATSNAVSAFQEIYHLPVTGKTDRMTWDAIVEVYKAALKHQLAPQPIFPFRTSQELVHPGDRGDEVLMLQLVLRALYKPYGNLTLIPLTGIFDEATQNALKQIQAFALLEQTGQLTPETWTILTRLYDAR